MQLLERDALLAEVGERVRLAAEGAGSIVLLMGESGIGKSSIARAVAEEARDYLRVVWGWCDPLATPVPLGPLIDIARSSGGTLKDLVESDAPRHALFHQFVEDLQTPSLIILEDIHWIDEASIDLLRFVVRRLRGAPSVLLFTCRSDELRDREEVRQLLALFPHDLTLRLSPQPLSAEAVATLAAGRGVDAVRIHTVSGGNPFLATQLIAGGEEIPSTVRDVLLSRLNRLSELARALAETVSIFPSRAERWLIEEMGHEAAVLDELYEAALLRDDGETVSFPHEIARAVVEESLSPARRRELHARVVGLLAGWRGASAPRVVHHAERAGDAAAVIEFGMRAAEEASRLRSHREALAHYRLVLDRGEALPPEERGAILERLAYEAYLVDQIEQALCAREEAIEIWRSLGDALREGDNTRWCSRLLWFLGRREESHAAALRAITLLEPFPQERELAWAYSNLGHLHMLSDERDEAVEWASRALSLAERLGDREIRSHALNNLGSVRYYREPVESRRQLEESLRIAVEDGLEEHAARAFTNLGSSAIRMRDYAYGGSILSRGIEYCRERDLDAWALYMGGWQARYLLDQGEWLAAGEVAGAVLNHPHASPVSRFSPLVVLALLRARRGDPAHAPVLEEAWALARSAGEIQRIAMVAAADCEAAWMAGRLEEAMPRVSEAYALARAKDSIDHVQELGRWMVRGGAVLQPIASSDDSASALEIGRRWEEAAEVWLQVGCRWEAALALIESGGEGNLRRALELIGGFGPVPLAARVRQRLREMGAKDLPRTVRQGEAGAELTARQLDVLRLLAAGLPNQEIAEHLFISAKTVDHHVSAILARLGARSRGEAAVVARKRGIPID